MQIQRLARLAGEGEHDGPRSILRQSPLDVKLNRGQRRDPQRQSTVVLERRMALDREPHQRPRMGIVRRLHADPDLIEIPAVDRDAPHAALTGCGFTARHGLPLTARGSGVS